MAISASTNWYVRAGGDVLNGGGWDSTIAGAGINYADADSPILSLTDLATTGAVATVTSATGGFTSNMVGNCLRIASGTNFTPGYYFVVTYTNANTVVLDRACATAAGSGGTGRIGGAFATPWGSLSSGGSVTAPTLTTPLAAGNTVWIRGAGTDSPGSADYSQGNTYAVYPNGDIRNLIRFRGYNGTPRIDCEVLAYGWTYATVERLIIVATSATNYPTYAMIGLDLGSLKNVTLDQAGYDRYGTVGWSYLIGCRFHNSGSTSAGTRPAASGGSMFGSLIDGWRGPGYYNVNYGRSSVVLDSIVANCKGGVGITVVGYQTRPEIIVRNCSVYGNSSHGILAWPAGSSEPGYGHLAAPLSLIYNNVIVSNGGYGLKMMKTAAENDLNRMFLDHNAFYGNASGARYELNAGEHDITLTADPFIDAANGDLRLNGTAGGGADVKDVAFPLDYPAS